MLTVYLHGVQMYRCPGKRRPIVVPWNGVRGKRWCEDLAWVMGSGIR